MEHGHNFTYLVKCPENICSETCIGKTYRILSERIMAHAGKVNKSHMLKHRLQSGHSSISPNEFKILWKGYNNNKLKGKVSEALLIRKHELSVPSELF